MLTRYYLGDCYEIDETPSGNKEKLYLAGENYYDASAVLVKDHTNSWKLYYIGRDYLGSITDIITEAGTKYASYNFDAWGRQRNSSSHVYIPSGQEVELFLGRGYSGHEHLKEFGLVNMNARLYDPALGRFLAPDPFVQMPDLSQNFNRYSYAMNNPLRYVDEDGEFIHIIIGAVIGGTANLIYKAVSGQLHSFKDGFAAFGIGAAAGGLGAATGGLAFAAAGGAAGGIGGFLAGAAAGSASTAVMMPVQSAGNSLYFGDQFMSLKDYGLGILGGALTGGIGNGTVAALKGNNFWTGKDVKFGRTIFSFKNTATRPAPEMRLMEAPGSGLNVTQPDISNTPKLNPVETSSQVASSSQSSGTTRFVTTPDGVTHDLQPTIDRIRSGKLFTFRHDGAIYYNNEGKLPNLSNGVYKEYVHPTPGLTRGAGPMRVITGGSKMWFTPDHYGTMIQIKF